MKEIILPVSKSIGARFLVATYFAGTLPADPFFEDNDDLMVLQRALLTIFSDEEPIDYGDTLLDMHASGTAMRFVTAVCASSVGADYVITGTPRLCNRPMTPLIRVLCEAGAYIKPVGKNETGLYRIVGKRLSGGEFSIEGNISSQFISALLLVAPSWEKGLKLNFTTSLVSKPYIEMTVDLMKRFGIDVLLNDTSVEVKPGKYKEPAGFKVEADWSSASFFYEACVLGAGDIFIQNLINHMESVQGDSVCDNLFQKLGVTTSYTKDGALLKNQEKPLEFIKYDFKDCPDLVLPYAVSCMCRDIKFEFTGISNLRLKESDRVSSLVNESKKLGFYLISTDDSLKWDGLKTEVSEDIVIDTYEDHRVGMSFAVTALKFGKIVIKDPKVVEKSFADFWIELEKLGLRLEWRNDSVIVNKE